MRTVDSGQVNCIVPKFQPYSWLMSRTLRANKLILFAQIFNPYEVTLSEFAQINHALFAHVHKALSSFYLVLR